MYQPKHYKKDDIQFAHQLIKENPFGEFVVMGDHLLATHIPILIDSFSTKFRLYSHIANHNPQYEYLKEGTEALLIFKGADAYISSSWYKEKDISTWDYSAVHINCKIKLQTEKELRESLKNLVHHFEKRQDSPLEYDEIPNHIIESHISQITGFWCEPQSVKGIGKWHQKSDKKDIENIIGKLQKDACPHTSLIKNLKNEHGL